MASNLTTITNASDSVIGDASSPDESVISDVMETSLDGKMDHTENAATNIQDTSCYLEDKQEMPDAFSVAEIETDKNNQMDELKIEADEPLAGSLPAEYITPREGNTENRTPTLPEEYLSPSSECVSARTENGEYDDLQWSIRFQPDVDRLSIGDSYLRRSPVNSSTPAVKSGILDLPKKAAGDLLSRLYGEEQLKDEDAQSEDERRLAQSCKDLTTAGQDDISSETFPRSVFTSNQESLAELDTSLETALKKTDNSLDISTASDTDDYMPLEERIKLLGINLDRKPEDTEGASLEESGSLAEDVPAAVQYQTANKEQGPHLEQEEFPEDLPRERQFEVNQLISPTRHAGDGGDSSLGRMPQNNSLNKSGPLESFNATYFGSSRSTDILFSTGELSLTSLEVARILSNAVQEDDGDWRKERLAADGGATEDVKQATRNQDLVSHRIMVSLQMEGPDLRVGVGQESLAERTGGYSQVQCEAGDLQLRNDSDASFSVQSDTREFGVGYDRHVDGESMEVVGGVPTSHGNGQGADYTDLNESLNFVSDEELSDNQRNLSDALKERSKENPLTGVESGEDRWVLERSISGSSGSDHQDHSDLSAFMSPIDNSALVGLVQKNNNAAGIAQEMGVGSIELWSSLAGHHEQPPSNDNEEGAGDQALTNAQRVSDQETNNDDSIPSLVADEGLPPMTVSDLQVQGSVPVSDEMKDDLEGKTLVAELLQSVQQGMEERAGSPASSTSNTVDTLDLDVRQILNKYGKSLTDEDTEDERKSTESTTRSEKDRNLRLRVRKLLGVSHNTDSETYSDSQSDNEWTNKLRHEYSTDAESETERKVANSYNEKPGNKLDAPDGKEDHSNSKYARNSDYLKHDKSQTLESQSLMSPSNVKQRNEGVGLELPTGTGVSSTRSSQSGSISYEYLQQELDEIQKGLAELQKYDMSKDQQNAMAVSSSNSLRIGDSDRESEIGTPRKYSWDYSADLGAQHSAEGRFLTRRRKFNEEGDALGFAESQSSAGTVTPTPSLNEQEHTKLQSHNQHARRLFPLESSTDGQLYDGQFNSHRAQDVVFRASLLPSHNISAAQKVLARFAEEEKLRKKRFQERDLAAMSVTRLLPPMDQDLHAADKVHEMMQRDSPAKQAYDFLEQADQERHLLEIRQYIHAQVREAATPVKSALDHKPISHEPLSALGAMRNFLSSQLVKTAQENLDHSFKYSVSDGQQDQIVHHDTGQSRSSENHGIPTTLSDHENRLSEHMYVRGKSSMSTRYNKKLGGALRQKYQSSDSDTEGDRTVVSRTSTTDEESAYKVNSESNPRESPYSHRGSVTSSREGIQPEVNPAGSGVASQLYSEQREVDEDRNIAHGDPRSPQNDSQSRPQKSWLLENHLRHTHGLISSTADFSEARHKFTSLSQVSKSEGDLTKAQFESAFIPCNAAQMNRVDSSKSSPRSLPDSSRSRPANLMAKSRQESSQSPFESSRSLLESSRSPLESSKSPMESSRSPMESSRSPMESSRSPMESSRSQIDSSRSPHNSSRSSSVTPTNLRPYRPPGSNQVYYVESDFDDGSTSMTTMESTHVGSDDARGPEFHPTVYGTRQDPAFPTAGIYHKKKSAHNASPTRGIEVVKVLDPIHENASFDERRTAVENIGHNKIDHLNNNANAGGQQGSRDMSAEQTNKNGIAKTNKETSCSLNNVKEDSSKDNPYGGAGLSNLGTRNDSSVFRTPKRVSSATGTPSRMSSQSLFLDSAPRSEYPSGNFRPQQQGHLDKDKYAHPNPRSETSSAPVTEQHTLGSFTFTRTADNDHLEKHPNQETWLNTDGNFKPLQPDVGLGNSLPFQRSSGYSFPLEQDHPTSPYYLSDGTVTHKHKTVENEYADLEYQRLEESYKDSASKATKSQEAWSPSPIALRDHIRNSHEHIARSPADPTSRHDDDTWESNLPADINDMWERFKQSSLFTESEPESVDVDLSRLKSLITNPVRHLVEELRNERRERRHLERQLLENLRNERGHKSGYRTSTSPGKLHHRESELSQHHDTDSSVTSVTSRSEVSDLLESDIPSDVTLTSSNVSVSSSGSNRKVARKTREDTLQSIPESLTIESAEITTDSEQQSQHSVADSSLLKLKLFIQEQKDKYLKDSQANKKRLFKIAKLESMLASNSRQWMSDKELHDALTDNSTLAEEYLRKDEVPQGREKHSKATGSPSRSNGPSRRSTGHKSSSYDGNSPSRSKTHSSKQDGQSPRSRSNKDRGPSRIANGHRSKSPAKRESSFRSVSPSKSPSKLKKSKKEVDGAPPMELKQVRYDNEPQSPSPTQHVYMEFENPRHSHDKKKPSHRTNKDSTNDENAEKSTKSKRKKGTAGESKGPTDPRNMSPEIQKNKRSVAVNVPTPISLSPSTRRTANDVTMVSESVQTTPSLHHTSAMKKTRGLYTPDQSELSNISENDVPDKKHHTAGPGLAWFVTFDKTKPWRQPLRERQESTRPSTDRPGIPSRDGGTGSKQWILDRNAELAGFANKFTSDLVGLSNAKDALSLQDAFRMHCGDVIQASRERQKLLYLKAQEQYTQDVNEQERALLFGFQQQFHEANPFAHPYSDQLHRPKRRFLTKREIKELTRKNYKRLPEVTQKSVQQRTLEERRANRIRARIFAKKVQNKLLHRHSAWA